jgi:hypothetical protein
MSNIIDIYYLECYILDGWRIIKVEKKFWAFMIVGGVGSIIGAVLWILGGVDGNAYPGFVLGGVTVLVCGLILFAAGLSSYLSLKKGKLPLPDERQSAVMKSGEELGFFLAVFYLFAEGIIRGVLKIEWSDMAFSAVLGIFISVTSYEIYIILNDGFVYGSESSLNAKGMGALFVALGIVWIGIFCTSLVHKETLFSNGSLTNSWSSLVMGISWLLEGSCFSYKGRQESKKGNLND